MRTSVLLFFSFFFTARAVKSQSLSFFDTKLKQEKLSLCDVVTKYVDLKDQRFQYEPYFGPSMYFISVNDHRLKIPGYWGFAIRNDSLNQYSFTSIDGPITAEWFNKLHPFADSTIKYFTSKFGKPVRDTSSKKNFFVTGKKFTPGVITKAMWILDGDKLKIDLSIVGEHDDFSYQLSIHRFRDYYGNMELRPWWSGY